MTDRRPDVKVSTARRASNASRERGNRCSYSDAPRTPAIASLLPNVPF